MSEPTPQNETSKAILEAFSFHKCDDETLNERVHAMASLLHTLQGDKELASLEIALAIDKMMEDMTVRLVGGDTAIIEVKHPKGYEYPPIEITVKKIVDQFIKDELSGSPWEDDFPEYTKKIVDSFYNQAVRLKKAFNKYASQKYIPKK